MLERIFAMTSDVPDYLNVVRAAISDQTIGPDSRKNGWILLPRLIVQAQQYEHPPCLFCCSAPDLASVISRLPLLPPPPRAPDREPGFAISGAAEIRLCEGWGGNGCRVMWFSGCSREVKFEASTDMLRSRARRKNKGFSMRSLLRLFSAFCKPKMLLAVENVCLRQQLAVLGRQHPHPRISDKDRRFWILMSRWFAGWRECLVVVKPETVLAWHRKGWRYYWRWKSRRRPAGRKRIPLEVRQLIRRMAQENPLWGQVRIMGELLKLGYAVSPRTVRKYLRRPWSGRPSPHWREFLNQHAKDIWACDFLTVRTLTFQALYVYFLIRHDTREIVHIRVTRHPTAAWAAQQVVNACLESKPPKFLIRDRDSIYGAEFSRRTGSLGILEIRTPVRAPKANAVAERFVGTLRRECLNHVFIFNERQLQKLLAEFADYYNHQRPHRSLALRPPCPLPEAASLVATGSPPRVIAEPVLGGLHHVYRIAA